MDEGAVKEGVIADNERLVISNGRIVNCKRMFQQAVIARPLRLFVQSASVPLQTFEVEGDDGMYFESLVLSLAVQARIELGAPCQTFCVQDPAQNDAVYEIDMSSMTQVRTSSGRIRRIRCVVPDPDDNVPDDDFDDVEEACVPDELKCPISMCLFKNPVRASDGFVYENRAIVKWLGTKRTSPCTNLRMPSVQLVKADDIKKKADDYRANVRDARKDPSSSDTC